MPSSLVLITGTTRGPLTIVGTPGYLVTFALGISQAHSIFVLLSALIQLISMAVPVTITTGRSLSLAATNEEQNFTHLLLCGLLLKWVFKLSSLMKCLLLNKKTKKKSSHIHVDARLVDVHCLKHDNLRESQSADNPNLHITHHILSITVQVSQCTTTSGHNICALL